ncbi:lytic transglycosylase domain-containing protein [Chelativorans sp. Marseille-P2723]|uniref:lytic transglycosylase domain-containing protein n=1 Tax=Chelativorans sp. Marseille-P2723 TaxID=2709133 RepID=UPI00156EFFD4|nr:lytic transglycosylase domain-containing protein [Chelativorans sp. Marseille-P2723]
MPENSRAAEAGGYIASICSLIETHSALNDLPAHFLARLLWKESLFNPNAVSPKGAQGIAQFMPATAAARGLRDAFDAEQAIAASAKYLSELEKSFGNLGLAAAAYNAGEARVSRWLASGGFLPLETENYVLDILGQPADLFVGSTGRVDVPPLDSEEPFGEACRKLPVSASAISAMASIPIKPWGIQVAGHFRREVAIRMWDRLRRQMPEVLSAYEPVVSRVRSPRGRSGLFAVRVGAESRAEADRLCGELRSAGGACVVLRNR